MAGIDKTYCKDYNEYIQLKNWAKNRVYTCPNGQKILVEDYIYDCWKEYDFNGRELPIMQTSMVLDYFMIKDRCPVKCYMDTMRKVYTSFVDEVLEGRSDFDTFSKEGKIATKFKIVKSSWHNKKYVEGLTWIEVLDEDGNALRYDNEYNIWIWPGELGEGNTSVAHKGRTIKGIIRMLRKWNIPKGATVYISGIYVGEEWEIACK